MSDDQTKVIAPPATPPTQPTIVTVLERITQLGESLNQRIDEAVAQLTGKIESEIQSLRTEMQAGFKKLDRRLDVLTGEVIDLKEKQREIEKRLDEPENKPS